jgi:pimeloyl-ACP methyl ester carboxylesterase
MVALYRCGRQADALATYQRARARLVDELGLEPGGELRRIEEAILVQDRSLAAPSRGPRAAAAAGTPTSILRSPVRYTRSSSGVSIAYQVAGDGPIDILAVPGFVSHLDIWWNAPTDGLVRRLTSVGRLISFDKRGMGLSDRPESIARTDWTEDAVAVLDAVGARDVVVLGISAGTPTAIRLAALHADRVRALVVFAGGARSLHGTDYPIGLERASVERFAENLERGWGSGVAISTFAPSLANDAHVRGYWARYQQLAASPSAAMRSFWSAVEDDVVDLLPSIEAPTLVLHPERDRIAPIAWGRFLAERIPNAEFVALDSDVDLICVSDVITEMAAEIAAFVGRVVPESLEHASQPTLVTVVAVATASAEMRAEVRAALERFGGRVQLRPEVTVIFDAPGRALRAAEALLREVGPAATVGIGIGIDVGECVLTDVGYRGAAVDVAHRLALEAEPSGEILTTPTVRHLVPGAS